MPNHLCRLVLLGEVIAHSAAADPLPFEGKWAVDPKSCVAETPAAKEKAPIMITANRLMAPPFMTCDFTSVLPGGISFRVEAACDAGGQHGAEFFTFAVLSGRLYWSWGGQTAAFDRCPN